MMYCPKCGAPHEDGASFCPKCGQPLNASNQTCTSPVRNDER